MKLKSKYQEAVERAKELYEAGDALTKSQMEIVFPELKESEDERIKKDIVFILNEYSRMSEEQGFLCNKSVINDALAYLERQKELKSAEKQDYSALNDLERAIHRGFLAAGVENVSRAIIKETAQDSLAQMKPAEWSEEDENYMEEIISNLKYAAKNRKTCSNKLAEKCIHWLEARVRFLRPQPSWRPSEEQISILGKVFAGCELNITERDSMVDLFYNLKQMI